MHTSSPLQIVRTWVSVLFVRTERTDIARAVMNQSMSDHLVLPLEALASFTPRTIFNRTVVVSHLAMNILMRAKTVSTSRSGCMIDSPQQVLRLERGGVTVRIVAHKPGAQNHSALRHSWWRRQNAHRPAGTFRTFTKRAHFWSVVAFLAGQKPSRTASSIFWETNLGVVCAVL